MWVKGEGNVWKDEWGNLNVWRIVRVGVGLD